LDKTLPPLDFPAQNDLKIIVTRINVEEVIKKEDIDFKIIAKTNSKLGWREKKIETKGEKGEREIKYKITYQDGKEISRVVLEKNIVRKPIDQVETQGTYVELGKKHEGLGTWYAFKGGLFAANPWLPLGSYVKVTNRENGKSVIVQINDRGPFGPGRIIDLDKVAFQKIASLGAGVIEVKMEEILN
jgi:rare lipoprotein A (peptidoglycan hydrolase)